MSRSNYVGALVHAAKIAGLAAAEKQRKSKIVIDNRPKTRKQVISLYGYGVNVIREWVCATYCGPTERAMQYNITMLMAEYPDEQTTEEQIAAYLNETPKDLWPDSCWWV